jgi:hypothetical protein
MSIWNDGELDRIGRATELQVASRRPDGTLRPFVTIWVVRAGNDVFVRSANGCGNPWFQRALHAGQGHIRVGGVERDVQFEVPGPEIADTVSAAYHAKYDRYGASTVGAVASPEAIRSTLRVMPA